MFYGPQSNGTSARFSVPVIREVIFFDFWVRLTSFFEAVEHCTPGSCVIFSCSFQKWAQKTPI
jgi:hypothetical protein